MNSRINPKSSPLHSLLPVHCEDGRPKSAPQSRNHGSGLEVDLGAQLPRGRKHHRLAQRDSNLLMFLLLIKTAIHMVTGCINNH